MRLSLRRGAMLLGAIVGLGLVAIFAVRLDWLEFRRAMLGVSWAWVAAGAFALLLSISVRAMRWLVISADKASASYPAYWSATVIGYVGNALYPGRAGEILRAASLHHAIRMPPGSALATAFMDRMADIVGLGIVALYVIIVVARGRVADTTLCSVLAFAIACVAVFIGVLFFGQKAQRPIARAASVLPKRWAERLPQWYSQAVAACRQFATPKRLAGALAFTVSAFVIDYGALWFFIRAFDWHLPLQAAITVGVFLAIGSLLPAAPGYVGIYQVACVLALHLHGIAETAALAYSVVAQVTTLAVISVSGVVAAWRQGMHFGSAP